MRDYHELDTASWAWLVDHGLLYQPPQPQPEGRWRLWAWSGALLWALGALGLAAVIVSNALR